MTKTKPAGGEPAKAPFGQRMLTVQVRFFTDSLAPGGKGDVLTRHALTKGVVRMTSNEAHGIKGGDVKAHFNTLAEIGPAIEEVLDAQGIVLHPVERTARLLSGAPIVAKA